VRALCDRRFGIGADGVIRVAPASAMDGPPGPGWFMDYWNSDGSLAEMCGNGARLFARHLVDAGAEQPGEFLIGTRGGARRVHVPPTGAVSVSMGVATGVPNALQIGLDGHRWSGHGAFVPNPHVVAFVDDLATVGSLDGVVVSAGATFPEGVNVEWAQVEAPDRLRMRVLERGAGETLSCGTGACAVAWVHRRIHPVTGPHVTVAVPGGEVVVTEHPEGELILTGPTQFVAAGTIEHDWWRSLS
jgi:diaminopimelate epimerase